MNFADKLRSMADKKSAQDTFDSTKEFYDRVKIECRNQAVWHSDFRHKIHAGISAKLFKEFAELDGLTCYFLENRLDFILSWE